MYVIAWPMLNGLREITLIMVAESPAFISKTVDSFASPSITFPLQPRKAFLEFSVQSKAL